MSINVAIVGPSGRMGRALIEAIMACQDIKLVGALDRVNSPSIGQDAALFLGAKSGVNIESNSYAAFEKAHTVIDFTRPEATMSHINIYQELKISVVIGTTGFNPEQMKTIKKMAMAIPIVLAPNMSVGVNVTFKLLEMAAAKLQENFDIEIQETHHKHKVDAPSGTALKMGEIVANAQNKNLNECAVYDRHGIIAERKPGSIGFTSNRGGDIVGDHTVLFAGSGERIEISHKSSSRATYAQGSLAAVRFLQGKAPNLYNMFDVLGF